MPVVHLINAAGQDIYNTLSSSVPFVTDFKGSGDVTVTELAGSLDPDYTDTFWGVYSSGNPDYVTNFVGATTNGTGDGAVGDLEDIQTSGGLSLQFDFALRLTPNDRLFIIDCDFSEQYRVQAFIKSGSSYIAESLVNWAVQNYPGSTQVLPNSSFPAWSAASGLLTAQTAGNLNEPLTIFTPDQAVDRVIITQLAVGGGTASLQFIHPIPPSLGTLGINYNGTNVVLTVPVNSVVASLQTTTNLAQPVWTTLTNNAGPATIPLPMTNGQQFFRLTY